MLARQLFSVPTSHHNYLIAPITTNSFRLETALFDCHALAVVPPASWVHFHGTSGYTLALQLSAVATDSSLIKIATALHSSADASLVTSNAGGVMKPTGPQVHEI